MPATFGYAVRVEGMLFCKTVQTPNGLILGFPQRMQML